MAFAAHAAPRRGRAHPPPCSTVKPRAARRKLARNSARDRASTTPMAEAPSTLVYDGDCGICGYWINYWRGLTGARVRYRPYQEAAVDYPAIPLPAFARSIQLIEPDGEVYSGAAATYRVLRHAPGRGAWWWLYRD